MRPPSAKCLACGPEASIRVEEFDYAEFCAGPAMTGESDGLTLGREGERISAKVSIAMTVWSADPSGEADALRTLLV